MVKIPLFPSYIKTQKLIKCLNGKNVSSFKSMCTAIWNLRGTPQEPVDWQNPDQWIPERLTGPDREFAQMIWNETDHQVNPRYVRGIQFLIDGYDLINSEPGDFRITERGKIFISNMNNEVMEQIDVEEGCIFILYLCSINRESSRKAFLKEWGDYLKTHSNYRKDSVIKDSLRRRLVNLLERNLISRDGNRYDINTSGEKYLARFEDFKFSPDMSEESQLNKQVDDFNKKQKKILKSKLYELSPTQFEHLIKDLLDAMGYEDVLVTSAKNDKGVDVVGNIQNGITMVREVIQVKRLSSNIQRPILDALRGCLHRFDAFQGTIITLSDFSKGTKEAAFERGAAPITLINGEKLMDLLIENEIAVKNKQLDYFTVDNSYFTESEEEEE